MYTVAAFLNCYLIHFQLKLKKTRTFCAPEELHQEQQKCITTYAKSF